MTTKEDVVAGTDEMGRHILLLAGSSGGPVAGTSKLRYMLHLMASRIPLAGEGAAYGTGMSREMVDVELGRLRDAGLVHAGPDEIRLSDTGERTARRIAEDTDTEIMQALDGYKDLLNSITRGEMLAFMHSAYPETADGSAECEAVRRDTEPLLLSLVEKGKISSQRAAELLGTRQIDIINKMNKMGMRVLGI